MASSDLSVRSTNGQPEATEPKPSPVHDSRVEHVNGAGLSADLMAKARTAKESGSLFDLFAELAKEAGRDDLVEEFRRRANEATGPAAKPGQAPRPEDRAAAAKRHTEACKLVTAGKLDEAETAFRDSLRLDPTSADAHGNLGVALARLNRLPEAEASFRLAIRLSPTMVTMYVNLATCLLNQKRNGECDEWARQAIQLDPNVSEAHRLLGCSLENRSRFDLSEAAFKEATRVDPKNADAHYRRGLVLNRLKRPDESEAAYRAAVKHKPTHAAAWAALGSLLESRDRATEAVESAKEAVRLEPNVADWHNNLGVGLAACEKPAEAAASYREAIRLAPTMAGAHSNLGNALRALDQLEEAEASLREALRLKRDYPEAHNNLGIVLVQAGRCDEGMKHYDESLRLKPEYAEAHMNRSLSLLAAGDFERGWSEYEWRWKVRHVRPPSVEAPRWEGGPLEGKTILLTAEQGLGDTLNFVRYASLVKARGAESVILECQGPLVNLVTTCPGLDKVLTRGTKLPPVDAYAPLMSLPGIFGVPPASSPAAVPYFKPDPERVEYWKSELAGLGGLRVGIAWQGSKVHKGDKLRSVRLSRFAPLAAVPGITLCSLQKEPGIEQLTDGSAEGMDVVDLGKLTAPEITDVAALMMNLDLVVTVDTALGHLAGALGRPVWVAIPTAADWRWGRTGEDTCWYPSMRLFRQSTRGDWDAVFGRFAAALAGVIRAKAEGQWDIASPVTVEG